MTPPFNINVWDGKLRGNFCNTEYRVLELDCRCLNTISHDGLERAISTHLIQMWKSTSRGNTPRNLDIFNPVLETFSNCMFFLLLTFDPKEKLTVKSCAHNSRPDMCIFGAVLIGMLCC